FGGAYNFGTIFKITASGTLTTLHSFRSDSDGAIPQAGLTFGSDGSLYGTTREAPPYRGSAFKITTNGDFTVLARFNGTNGAAPWNGALVQGSDGHFYGTTSLGGSAWPSLPGYGTVFRVTTNGVLDALHSFDHFGGATPYGGLIQAA